jgi:hypothetical protein
MKGIMTLILILMMIYLLPAKADILLDIINGTYEEPSDITYEPEEPHEDHALDNGEVYHWDNLYLCTYCYDTEVILDPYGSENEVGLSD